MMKFKFAPKEQQTCNHPSLFFGSGDYYVMCTVCDRTWVKVKAEADEADPECVNDTLTGKLRHELTLTKIKVIVDESKQ